MSGEDFATNGLQSAMRKIGRRSYSFDSYPHLARPDLKDDYYLKLISWTQDNILVVALLSGSFRSAGGKGQRRNKILDDDATPFNPICCV
jgi:hypothetical protein